MQPKKNPQADLNRRTGLFFSIGLAIATGVSLFAINYKTTERAIKVENSAIDGTIEENPEEVVINPNTPPPPPPPPPPPTVVESVEVVKDDIKVETVIANTDINNEGKVEAPPIDDVEEDDTIPEEIPFTLIEDKPMFEACKGNSKAEQEKCFKEALDNHVRRNFKYPEDAMDLGIQGRVYVSFRIKKDGSVEVVNTRGPAGTKSLENEARRIIEKLPKMIPGKQRGKAVAVTYAYPIVFRLN